MKRGIWCLSFLLTVLCASGQQKLSDEVARADVRAKKVDLIASNMQFTDQETQAFFPVYRKYEAELAKIWDVRLQVIEDYRANVDSMTDAKALQLSRQSMDLEKKYLALREKYFKEFSKALTPKRVAKFFQVERRINLMVEMELAGYLPPLK